MKLFREVLNLQDNFYMQFTILFKGDRRIHSKIGVILSLLINFICIAMFITLLFQLINHSNPSVTTVQLSSSVTTNITLNTKDLLLAIGLRDKFFQTITDNSIARLIPYYQLTVPTNNTLIQTEEELDIVNCTALYPLFKELGIENRFDSNGLKDYNCFNNTKSKKEIVLGGKYGDEFYGNLAFYVKKCRNSTDSNIVCKPEEVINDYIQGGWLQITYVTSFVDFNNFTSPIQYVTENFYTTIDVNLNKVVYSFFMPVYFYSENNIIFSNTKNEKAIKNDKHTTDINLSTENGVLYTIYICPSFNVDKYYRRYVKIQEIGASTGGFWSGLSIVGIILLTFPQLQDFQMKIANSLFEFSSEKRLTHGDFLFVPKIIKQISSKQILTLRKNKYKLDLGMKNTLRLFVFQCSNNAKDMKKQYDLIQNKILKYIDFTQASRIFREMDMIKNILIHHSLTSGFPYEKIAYDITPGINKKLDTTTNAQQQRSSLSITNKKTFLYDQSSNFIEKKPMINTLIKAPSVTSTIRNN